MTHTLEHWLERYEAGQIDRRGFLAGVAGLMTSSAAAQGPLGFARDRPQASVTGSGLHHVEIKTTDLARSSAFYRKLFGVTGETRSDRVVLPFGNGPSNGYLSIGVGPIPRV